jgi:hypothetical protein
MKAAIAAVACLVIAASVSAANASDGYSLADGTTTSIDEHGACRKVTNNSGKNQYVPTTAAAEWTSFYSTTHPGVTMAACLTNVCAGFAWNNRAWSGGSVLSSTAVADVDACKAQCGAGGSGNCTFITSTGVCEERSATTTTVSQTGSMAVKCGLTRVASVNLGAHCIEVLKADSTLVRTYCDNIGGASITDSTTFAPCSLTIAAVGVNTFSFSHSCGGSGGSGSGQSGYGMAGPYWFTTYPGPPP